MRTALQMLGIGGLLVSLVACGSHSAQDHRSTTPAPLLKTVQVPSAHGIIEALDLTPLHQGWMITDQLNGHGYVESATLSHTTDLGKQWQVVARYPKQDATMHGVTELIFTNQHQGMALTSLGVAMGHAKYQLLGTINGGQTWRPTSTIWMPSGPVTLAFSSATHGMIIGGPGGGTQEAAAVTESSGQRWTQISLPGPSPVRIGASLTATRLLFSSPRDGFVVNAYWRMNARKQVVPVLQELMTHTGGRTWQRASLSTRGLVGTVTALSFSSPTTGWVALYSVKHNQTVIESTTDRGRRWRVLHPGGHLSLTGEVSVLEQLNAQTGCVAAQTHLWCTERG